MGNSNAKMACFILIIVAFAIGLAACTFPIDRPRPQEGVWYCEELMIKIDFGNELSEKIYAAEKCDLDGTCHKTYCMIYYGYRIQLYSGYGPEEYQEYLNGFEEARANGRVEEYIKQYEDAAHNAHKEYLNGDYFYQNGVLYITNVADKVTYEFKRIDD